MKALIMGGLGYLGGRFSELLADDPQNHIVLATRRANTRAPWAPSAEIAQVDPGDVAALANLCRGVDVVVHLAGMNAAQSSLDPAAALASRTAGTAAVLRAAASCGVRRLIYVSTAHVYGAALAGTVDEDTHPLPQHPYAQSHLAAEELVRAARARSEIEGVVVRLSNAFGAPTDASVDCWTLAPNALCREAVRARSLTLRTSGRQRRDFIAMSEACRALLLLCRSPREQLGFESINVGRGASCTLAELAERIAARVETRLGFRPDVRLGSAHDGVGAGALDYGVERLRALGFDADPTADGAELDRLIDFCVRTRACS